MFYVYALLDLRKPGRFSTPYVTYLYQPFYIGKGKNQRYKQHLSEARNAKAKGLFVTYKHSLTLKLHDMFGELHCVILNCDDEQHAYQVETDLIGQFGLMVDGGVLSNFRPGGAGGKGGKRPPETCKRISQGKQGYTFTEEHIANITAANQVIAQTVHLGAKRSQETKTAISKSRHGAKSKVAKIWKFTDPTGHEIIYKGGMRAMVELFNLSEARLIRFIGQGLIPLPTHSGHNNQSVDNCTGWMVEKTTNEEEVNFNLAYI